MCVGSRAPAPCTTNSQRPCTLRPAHARQSSPPACTAWWMGACRFPARTSTRAARQRAHACNCATVPAGRGMGRCRGRSCNQSWRGDLRRALAPPTKRLGAHGSTGSGSRPSGAGTRAGGRHVSRVGRARLSNWAESVAHTWPVEAVEHVQRVFGEHDEPVQPLCTPQRHRSINECISVIHLRARWTLGPKLHAATDPNAALARVPAQAPGTRTSTREVSPSRDSPGPARS
jgi:hypothetical protein